LIELGTRGRGWGDKNGKYGWKIKRSGKAKGKLRSGKRTKRCGASMAARCRHISMVNSPMKSRRTENLACRKGIS
jgi:hypothetical protein